MEGSREDEIRKRAHRIWEDEGRPEGREADHWARAARELDANGGGDKAPLGGLAEGSQA